MKFVLAAALAATAYAGCPNQCSGHGTCEKNDLCACYSNWQGADCSQRTCEFGRAWAVDGSDPHAYTECSGQGACNRQTGECECFDGFTGRACGRSTCPGDCSGHGQCKLLSEVSTTVAYDATAWDADRIQTCECDAGYYGPDCSLRRCPTGDDPLTLCQSDQYNQVQEVRFVLGSNTQHNVLADGTNVVAYSSGDYTNAIEDLALFAGYASDGASLYTANAALPSTLADAQLRISYVDSWGGKWTAHGVSNVLAKDGVDALTKLVPYKGDAVDSLEIALETLPNKKVNDVKVVSKFLAIQNADGSANAAATGVIQRAYQVTFLGDKTNSNNVGLQNALQCDTGYSCTEAGCQPMIKMPFLYRYASHTTAASAALGGTIDKATFEFFAADADTKTDFATNKKYIRLNSDSQPQMPEGIAVDTGASKVGEATFKRYDMRILIAVQDASTTNGVDDDVDRYYTRVIAGNTNIASTNEQVGGTSVFTAATDFTATLDNFVHGGLIPTNADKSPVAKIPVPGAPGVYIDFPSADLAGDNQIKFYEILIKLPHCSVTPVVGATDVPDAIVGTFATFVKPVDPNVENIECSGRGSCDRKSGQCKCFEGYAGLACHKQDVLFV